jgi:hypothetical protein
MLGGHRRAARVRVETSAAAARSSLVDKLVADIDAIGYEAARGAFIEAYKDLNSGPYYLSTSELNNLGYEFLHAKQPSEAVAIFELQVEDRATDSLRLDALRLTNSRCLEPHSPWTQSITSRIRFAPSQHGFRTPADRSKRPAA